MPGSVTPDSIVVKLGAGYDNVLPSLCLRKGWDPSNTRMINVGSKGNHAMLSYPEVIPAPYLYYNYIPLKHVIISYLFPAVDQSSTRLIFSYTPATAVLLIGLFSNLVFFPLLFCIGFLGLCKSHIPFFDLLNKLMNMHMACYCLSLFIIQDKTS
jgi:hypothetical protein